MSKEKGFNNSIMIGNLIKEAWQKVSGVKSIFFLSGILLPFFYFIGLIFTAGYLITYSFKITFHLNTMLIGMVVICLVLLLIFFGMFFLIALNIILGLRRAIGLPLSIKTASSQFFQNLGPIFIVFLLWFALNGGLFFFEITGANSILFRIISALVLYLLTLPLLCLTLPFIITQRVSASVALVKTYQIMRKQGLIIVLAIILMEIILAISMIPFGLGIIWTAPMFYILSGLLFRNAAGLRSM
ncbi:hypothetical protein BN59_02459 [Legionella massiliensis]|uniref:Uncharacterized protein n=1 Tax=Legionella massiliensis TaxID=1034943 RepID=A0A078KYK0_9GAMM|nr:hypothetical protein [Legionella massiliensis]CDZ78152.1 hypothetical protein BN59_02459 [Legionella massiliensis]CEE13890.1 hypothetical protein BN1094_02459 [Legionella massiliensis]